MAPSHAHPRSPGRRGLNLVGLLILLFIYAGVAIFVSTLARQSGRTGHWFYQSQLAFNLADAGLREALSLLREANSKSRARNAPLLAPVLEKVFDELAGGKAGAQLIPLFSSRDPAGLPPGVAGQIANLKHFDPSIEVSLRVLAPRPLLPGPVAGIPPIARETRGTLELVARTSNRNEAGLRVERTVTLQSDYKIVSILPPLLGRFALFVSAGPSEDPNIVRMTVDPQNGRSSLEPASPKPLVINAGPAVELVRRGTQALDRSAIAAAAGANALDGRGWVFLGGSDAAPWKLRLAHGWGDAGESPLLPGDRVRTFYKGTQDAKFLEDFQNAMTSVGKCVVYFRPPDNGLFTFHHGFATNFEIIGLQPGARNVVQRGGSRIALRSLEPAESSCLRLFGAGAHAVSPTVVFGRVLRVVARRANVRITVDPTSCPLAPGVINLNLLAFADHSSALRQVLVRAFGSEADYQEHGTGLSEDPYANSLNTVLAGGPSGDYTATGELFLRSAGGGGAASGSALLPWLGDLPKASLDEATLKRLWEGNIDLPRVYSGKLDQGLDAFAAAVQAKVVYRVKSAAVTTRLVRNKVLKVPGVAILDDGGPLELGPIDSVASGGILVASGPVNIVGDIRRGAGGEPLTVVSLTGDITIGPGVSMVEAYLAAPAGRVRFAASPLAISGGLACRQLDIEALKSRPAERSVAYAPDMDPAVETNVVASLRAFYGEERCAVSAGDS